jgi:hypothetical protein
MVSLIGIVVPLVLRDDSYNELQVVKKPSPLAISAAM